MAPPGPARPEERIPSPPKWIPIVIVLGVLALLLGVALGAVYAWRRHVAHRDANHASWLLTPIRSTGAVLPEVLLPLNVASMPSSLPHLPSLE